MKKFLLSLILLVCCISCTFQERGIKQEKTIIISENPDFEIVRIGNHQYIFMCHGGYYGGLCHYEDCDYCHGH